MKKNIVRIPDAINERAKNHSKRNKNTKTVKAKEKQQNKTNGDVQSVLFMRWCNSIVILYKYICQSYNLYAFI